MAHKQGTDTVATTSFFVTCTTFAGRAALEIHIFFLLNRFRSEYFRIFWCPRQRSTSAPDCLSGPAVGGCTRHCRKRTNLLIELRPHPVTFILLITHD